MRHPLQRPDPRLDAATLRRLAVQFNVDPRSIQRFAEGKSIRGMAGHRCAEALAEWRRTVGLDVAQGR